MWKPPSPSSAILARHYQCADPPDHGEPSHAAVDYARLFRAIDATGYTGWIGCEYKPRADTLPVCLGP